ncbi:putative Ig domain-containing protein [Dyella sp.]|uniref:putative Ig domain-containing protein n=1 Tax=Dyella sp. TaxID=1869338 RepID=UPI00283CC431|nr:putative Ig domain-containing protein [Dyella sp.]MDR3443766.1 putative Ig domain-containing protein [Dyella sp.]
MVAVISGSGLGLGNTSLTQLGQTSGGQASIGQAGGGQYLNLATGNLVLQNADEGLIVDGLPLNLLRTYNSLGQASGNQGWLFGFTRNLSAVTGTLNTAGSTLSRIADDGSTVTYAYNATLGVYVSQGQSGAGDRLSWNATTSNWTWTEGASRVQETYNASGQLQTLSDPETGASYSFGYNASNTLNTITASDGDQLQLGYTNGALTSLTISEIPPGGSTAVVRQQVTYGYDSQGRLQTVTTTLASDTHSSSTASYSTSYTYDGTSDRVTSVTQSDGTTVSYTYAADSNGTERVATITTGTGAAAQTLTLGYNLATDTTTVTDGLGNITTYTYNAAGQLAQVAAPAVNGSSPTTQYSYDANGNVLQVTDANGGITSYTYDANGNRLSAEDSTGHTVTYTYNADNQVISQTTYSVAAQGVAGQSGYVAPSGAQTTYYVYDASDRLNYVIDPVGNVTEHDYGTSSGLTVLTSTKQYVGVSYALAGLSPSTPPTLAQLQGWVAGGNVQAVLGQMVRTDYSYDVRGQLSQSIQWDVLNSSGQGTLSGDIGATVTRFTYDAQGRLLQSATARGSNRTTLETTSYTYDGLGRLLSSTDPVGNVTSYVYTDSGNQLAITQANGLTTTQVRNSAGELVSSTQSASGQASRVTSYLYNAAGQPVATIDPAGNVSYTFYDADGRVAGMVDATGAVIAYTYDADGHVIATTRYATLLSTVGWVSGGALTSSYPASLPVPTSTANDRTAHTLYDAAGRVIATIDAVGNVVTTAYDGEGNALGTTAYATALTGTQLTSLGAAPSWSALQADLVTSANDRTTHIIYDADNRPVASVDAAGYVTVSTYDAAGRIVKTTGYATALTSTQIAALGATPALAVVQADIVTNPADQTTRTYYNDQGQVVAQIDADGYLTTTSYDQTAHTVVDTRYGTALTSAQLSSLTGSESTAALVALLGSSPATQSTTSAYDADGRLSQLAAVDGTVTVYSYNTVGQLLSKTSTPATGQGSARTTSATYDAFGDVATATDGNGKVTTYTYNVLGQRTTATDALGNTTWTYYDADGRVAYTVQGQPSGATLNANGDLVAYTYNAFGQVASTRRYAGMLTLITGTSSGSTLNAANATTAQVAAAATALANPATDSTATYTYTLDGQVAGTIDQLGYQTASIYDAFGDLIQQQQQLSGPNNALAAANSTITTYAYDARGERTGQTDGAGSAVASSTSNAYDAFGRVTSTTDARGNTITYSYDNLGRQVSSSQVVQGATRTTQTTYDAFDRVMYTTDGAGNVTTYQYDLANHKTIVTTADGVTVTTVRDAFGDVVTVTDGAGDVTTYTYDGDGNLLTTKDALGNLSSNQYDADGHLTQTTDATGHVVTYTYDASGHVLVRTVDPSGLNLVTSYAYDGEGRELSVTDPTGSVTAYSYDADGHVLTQVQDAGTGKLNLTTTYTYDGAGRQLTVTVGAGTSAARTTQYVYDNLERLSQTIVDPSGLHLATSYTYDSNDNLTSVTDANGNITRTVYNEANEAVLSVGATGAVVQKTYDADGRITSVHAYATPLTSAQLSALGSAPSLAQVQADLTATGADQVSYTAYNAEGQVRYSIDPSGYVTETRYDSADRLSEVLAYAYAATVSASTAAALQQGTALASLAPLVSGAGNTDANAQATLHLYDADGRQRFTVQQNTVNGQLVGEVTEQRYDAAGRVTAAVQYGSLLTLSAGQSLALQWSTSSVAQALASAPSHVTAQVYDNTGRLRYSVDATSHVTETQYDADGRVTATIAYANAITLPGTATVASMASAVSAANSGTSGARLTTTTYDAAGRVTATGDALGTNASFQYDATGLQTVRANRDGQQTYVLYDKAGRKTLEQSPAVTVGSYNSSTQQYQTATQYLYTTYSYDSVGNVTAIGQGTGPDSAHVTTLYTTNYGYDAANHQTSTTYAGVASTHVTYNALGQAVVDEDADGHYQYKAYNADGELAYSIDGDGYVTATTYDAYGNALTTTRYATALNVGAISGWGAGQPLSLAQVQQGLVASGSDRTITTTYNQLNQKIQVQQSSIAIVLTVGPLAGQGANGSPTTTFTYDAYGNQTSSAVLIQPALTVGSTSSSAVWATTYNYYDALNHQVMTVDPVGYVTTTAYDAFGGITRVTQYAQAIGTSGLTTASQPGLPAAGTYATGYDRVIAYGYDAIGRKNSESDTGEYDAVGGTAGQFNWSAGATAASSVTTYGCDGEGRLTSLTVNGRTTTTAYDAAGRVISVTGPSRQVLVDNWQSQLANTSLDLTTSSLYTTVSPVTTSLYDALGNLLTTTVSAGSQSQVTHYFYDALNHQTGESDTMGNWFATTYDNNGNVLTQSSTLTGNAGSVAVTTTYTYDANNQQLSTVTQRSGVGGSDAYSQVQYNAFGEVIARGDNNGLEAQYTYNNAGQLSTAPDAKSGAIHTYGYDLAGHQGVDGIYVTGGSQRTWTVNTLDLDGRVVSRTTPSSSASTGSNGTGQRFTYDRWGNVSSQTDENGNTTHFYYDSQNRLIQQVESNVLVVSASGVRTWQQPTKEWYYSVDGWQIGSIDENGNQSWNAVDAVGNVVIAQDGVGNRTYTGYDSLGRAVAQQNPPTNTATGTYARITYTNYNALSQIVQQGDFLLNSTGNGRTQQAQQTYALDSNGDRIQVTDALGNTSYYSYDSQHRVLTSQTAIQHQSGWQESYTYDANGNKIGYTDANGNSESWNYDYFGRVQSHVDLSGATTSYTYDASSGLLVKQVSNWAPSGQGNPGYVPGQLTGSGSEQDYSYYADGQIQQLTQKVAGATSEWDTYQYDANGNQTNDTTYTMDGGGLAVHNATSTNYDSHNRITTVTTVNPDNSVASTRTVYNYDAAGNRRAVFVQSAYGNAAAISGSGAPPTGGPGTQTAPAGSYWNTNISGTFTDNVGFGLTFSATGLPSWLSLNSNGVFSGTPTTAGSWTVAVTATDVNGQSVTTNVVVNVPVAAPVFSAGAANQIGGVGGALNFSVLGATDPNGAAITYSASQSGGGALPSWLSFNASTLAFSGTPVPGSVGTYTIAVTATAANGGVTTETFTLNVQSTPPVINGTLSSQTVYGTRQFAFGFNTGAFYESDGDTLSYTAGTYQMQSIPGEPTTENDSALPDWMTFYTNTLTFSGTPPQSAVGQTFSIYVKGVNPQGQYVKGYFNITVAQYVQPPPVYNGNLANQSGVIGGASVNLPLTPNAFTEPDGGALTYTGLVLIPAHTLTINKGGEPIDTQIAASWVTMNLVGLSVNASTGAITGVPRAITYETSSFSTLVYATISSYQIQITATNAQGGAVSGTFTMNNSYAPIAVTNTMPAQTYTPGGAVFKYTMPSNVFYDPTGNTMTYTASNMPSWVSFDGSTFYCSGGGAAGAYNITVTARDAITGSTASTTLTINMQNVAPVFTAGATNISATQYQTFNYQPAGATDANGDVITYTAGYWNGSSWIGLPSWISFNASNHTYTGTPPSPGSYTFAMWATDSHGAGVGETFTVNVSAQPQPPQYVGTMNGKLFDFAYPKNVSISIANQFIDPQGAAINYTYSSSTGGIAPSWLYFNASTLTFTGNPNILRDSYLTYGITLTATDANNGLSTSITFTIGYQGKSTGVNSMAMQAQSVQTVQAAQAGVPDLQSFWFTYDADNRTVVNNGALSNGQIVLTGGTYEAPSFANQYDAAGNVVIRNSVNSVAYTPTFTHNVTYNAGDLLSQQMVYDGRNELAQSYYLVDTTIGQSNLGVQTKYWYDADGHQIGNNNYFASNALEPEQGLPDMPNGTMYMPIGGWLEYGAATSYNADGQVTQQVSWGGPTRDWHQLGLIWENGNPMPDEGQTAVPTTASDGQAVMASTTTYTAFDHEDNVTSYSFYQPGVTGGNPAYGANYTVNYIRKDSYLEQSTAGTPTVSGYLPATDTSYYDAFGQRIAVSQTSQNGAGNAQNVTRVFAYNATGEILERRTGTSSGSTFTPNGGNGTDHYVYANGQQIGDMDEAGDINVSGTLTGFSSGNPTQYVVASGDTLESIAQSVYGNSSLAYIIAAANGLTGDNGLVVGQAITVPSVTTNANTSTTFKPYNPGQIIGSTTPSLPAAPPPPPSSHCSGLAEIVVAAVIVVASIYTAGLAAEAMGATASSTWAAGAAAMTGASSAGVGASMAAAAAGGFVGSLAGQAAGDAMGVSHGFSLTAALTSGLASGLTAGIGGAIGGQGDDFSIVANSQGHLEPVGAGLLAGGQYASNSLVSKVTGQASHFSWAGLISTAVTSGITADAGLVSEPLQGLGLSSGSFGGDLAAGILSSGVSRETTKLLGDDHVASWGQTLEDAFGNALGNAAIAGMSSPGAAQTSIRQGSSPDWNNALSTYNAEGASGWREQNAAMSYALNSSSSVAAVNGGGDTGGDYLSLKASSIDDLYSAAQELKATGAPQVSFSTMSTDQVESYVHDYSELGIYQPDAQTLATVNVTPTAEDMAAAGLGNAGGGYEFGGTHGISDTEAFFTFNRAGQFLSGVGHQLKGMATSSMMVNPLTMPVVLPQMVNQLSDRYTQAYSQGQLGDAVLQDAGGAVHGLVMSTPVGFIKALNEKDTMGGMERLGSSTVDAAMWVVPGAIEGIRAGSVPNNAIVNGEGAYKDLTGKLDDGFQAHHLNQNAAFSSVIPKGEGFSIGIRGNAFTDVGTPHYDFHSSLEGFWDQYRVGGSSFGEVPTNAQYGDAVTQALQDAGLSPSEAQRLSDLAAQNRAAYDLSPNDPVPNIPRKIYQSGGN